MRQYAKGNADGTCDGYDDGEIHLHSSICTDAAAAPCLASTYSFLNLFTASRTMPLYVWSYYNFLFAKFICFVVKLKKSL